jgi:hypothetical protein
VQTSGNPTASIGKSGALPNGVTFVDNGNGTATVAGTPAAGSAGSYPLTITASNGVSPNATQNFTLTVNQAPAITSANNTSFQVGTAGTFTVTTTGSPTPSVSDGGATLPSGVTFVDNGNGTATLAGTPAAGSSGTYSFTITASNGVSPNATQSFTLTVSAGLTVTQVSPSSVGQHATNVPVTITGTGFTNDATVSASGTGVTFSSVNVTDSQHISANVTVTAAAATTVRDVTVTETRGSSTCTGCLTINPAPTVSTLSPNSLAQGAATNVTVTGTGFSNNPTLTFTGPGTGVKVTGVSSSTSTSITAAVTVGAAAHTGSYNLVVTNSDGGTVTCTGCLTVTVAPTVTSFSPGQMRQGAGPNLSITGTGFSNPTLVFIGPGGGIRGSDLTITPTSITGQILSPLAAKVGQYTVRIVNADGSKAICTNCLTVIPAPTVTAITPSTFGVGAKNVPVTITGTGFDAGAKLLFIGGSTSVKGTVTNVTSTSISATLSAPAGSTTGKYDLRVVDPDFSKGTLSKGVTVVAGPTITSIAPSSLDPGQSTTFTVTGTGFSSDATLSGPASLTFTNVVVNAGGTQVTATVTVKSNAHAATNQAVTVTNGPIGNFGAATNSTLTIT